MKTMRWLLLLALTVPASAQFRSVEMWFEGIGCASCMDSLPSRLGRIRGVQEAAVDKEKGVLRVRLADENRVRVEQIRDAIEQDGTKATRAIVTVRGDIVQENGRWVLKPQRVPAEYLLEWSGSTGGDQVVAGEIVNMRETPLLIKLKK
jgi:hypothetical protein